MGGHRAAAAGTGLDPRSGRLTRRLLPPHPPRSHHAHAARHAFYQGFGRTLNRIEREALAALLLLDALSGLAWGIPNGDTQMVTRARRMLTSTAS
jgi:hypothetical protein